MWAAALLVAASASDAHARDAELAVTRTDASRYPKLRAYVSVLDESGVPMHHLDTSNFRVFENGSNQVEPSRAVSTTEAGEGLSVVVVVQGSGTVIPVLDTVKGSLRTFFGRLAPGDRAALVLYADTVHVVAPLGDPKAALNAVNEIRSLGIQKRLFDGVDKGLDLIAGSGLRALIVFGDGGDAGSHADLDSVLREAHRLRTPIYAIGHKEGGTVDLGVMRDLVRGATGFSGAYLEAPREADIAGAFTTLRTQLQSQYLIEWSADAIAADHSTYPITVAAKIGTRRLQAQSDITTPLSRDDVRGLAMAGALLLLCVTCGLAYWRSRKMARA